MPTPSASSGYRHTLKAKLEERSARKQGYSLRAFARDIGYGPSQLSRVLSGKQQLSTESATLIADRLFDSEMERALFVAQVESEGARRPAVKSGALRKLHTLRALRDETNTHQLKEDAFQVISDWYHLPILELMALHDAPRTPAGVAKRLGISLPEAKAAIERLQRLGLLEIQAGRWAKTRNSLHVPGGVPSLAIRKFHRDMIRKAEAAIEGQAVERRYLMSSTLSLAPKDLPKYRALIDEFLQKANALNEQGGIKTSLYQLNVQFFDLGAEK